MSSIVRFWLWVSVFGAIAIGIIVLIWTILRVTHIQKQLQRSDYKNSSRPHKGVISLKEYTQIRPFLSEIHVDLLLNLLFDRKAQNVKFLVSDEFFEIFEVEKQLKITPQVKTFTNFCSSKIEHISTVFGKHLSEISSTWTDANYDFLFVETLTPENIRLIPTLLPSSKAIIFLLAKKFWDKYNIRAFLKHQRLRHVKLKNFSGALFVVFHG